MPLDESILGGSVPFDPSEVSANMVNRLGDQPVGTPVDTDIAIDRMARKVLAPRAEPVRAPTSKASDPEGKIAKPDLSAYGSPVDQPPDLSNMPDLSAFGEPVEPVAAPPATPPITPPVTTEAPKHNAVVRGFVTGLLKENPESAAEALEGMSHLAPKDFKDALGSASKDMQRLSKLSPEEYAKKSGSMWDIKSLDDAMAWAGETLGSGLASTVPSVAGGVVGGVAGGRVAGKTGAVVGAAAGASVPSAVLNYGQVYKALKDEKVAPEKAAEYAAWATVPMTALDTASIGPIIGRLGGITEVKAQLARAIARRIAEETAKGAGREGITEALQDVVQSATVSLASDKPFWTMETAKSAVENAVGGALVGGAMGAGSGIKSDNIAPAPAAQPAPNAAAPGVGPSAGPGPQPGPQPGAGPQGGPQAGPGPSPEAEDFIKKAQAAPNPDQGPDLSAMSEAEKVAAYAASRESHGGAREADILKTAGFSDEQIARMSDEARVDAVIRAAKPQENSGTQGADQTAQSQQQSNEQQKPSPEDEEYSILRAGGYTDENIRDMSPGQRASEAKYYRDDLGLDVTDAMRRFKRPQETASGQESPQAQADQVNEVRTGERTAPIKAATADDIVRALPVEPKSDAQAQAENYRHAHVDLEPLGLTGKNNVSIETGVGQVRKGTAPDGKAWEVRMPVAYGRIKGTKGADGQPLDIFIGPNPTSTHVFVIDQHHPGGKGFDEHKIMAGFVNPRAALEAYKGSYEDGGGDRIGHVRAMSADEFKAWLKTDTTLPIKNEPVSSTHDEDTGSSPLTEASVDEADVPKGTSGPGADTKVSEDHNAQTPESVPDTQSADAEILPPARVVAEPTQEHHDQIEAVLGQDYDRVLPVDATRAAEILAENEGMSPEVAFQYAVIEGAVEQKFLTQQEAVEAYGQEVNNVLEPVSEGTPRSGSDTEQAGTASEQERPGDAAETGVVAGGSETGGNKAGEGGERDKPNPRRKAADKSDTSGEADAAGSEPETVKTKIEDAGAKIGGARKDAWIGRGLGVDDLADMTGAELDKYVTKHNIWKKPDYVQAVEDGVPPLVAALIKRIYDGIAVKPNNGKYGNFSKPEDLRKSYIFALNATREAALAAKTEDDVRNINNVVTKAVAASGLDQWDTINTLKQGNARNSPLWISSKDVRWAQKAVEAGFPNAEPWTRLFVTNTKVTKPAAQPSAKQEAEAVDQDSKPKTLAGAFVARFMMGEKFENILQARRFAKESGFAEDAKSVEEAIELAMVRIARQEIASSASPKAAFRLLVDYYNSQPRLGTRTSTSVRDQAYSTPVPLGYLAQVLAGVTKDTTVLEPTAGNGALLTAADPAKVLANELNPDRRANLEAQGFKSTQWDAAVGNAFAMLTKRDVVIANPPFGAMMDGNASNASKVFDMSDIQPGYQTHEIDHAIALKALAAMKDNGRAVLILGGVNRLASTPAARSDAYNGKAKRQFYKTLYDNYNVTDHFTVSGDLYDRQGAAWPVDVIVIEGRGKSKRPLPAAEVPHIYDSWDSLGGLIDGVRRQETGNARPDQNPADQPAGTGPGLEDRGGRDRADAGSERGGNEQPGGVRAERGAATDADAGAAGDQERVSVDAGDRSARSGEQPSAERPSRGLSDDFDDIFNDALDAAYGKEEPSDVRGQPIIETGAVLRTKSGRETSPAPKIDATTDRKTKTALFNLDSWLLDEARKEVAGNDYQTTLLKGLNPKNFSQSDRDTVNSLLFGDPDGPRPSDIVRIEGPTKKPRATRSTEDVAKSAAENLTGAADDAFSALYQLFGGNKASSGFTFDEDTYKKAKPLFEQAAQKFKEFIGDTRELVNRMVAHMRDTLKWPREVMANMAPYLKRFIAELNEPKAQETKTEAPRAKREQAKAVETENQVTYKPQSKAPGLDTLVPVNMRRSISDALADLEDRVGPIDDFVAKELKYKDAAALEEYFGAEQVDALGLAIDNIKRGKGFIIGDQTGIGKGRVNAAIIRWAIVNDRIPMFVTEKPGLYADMYRDLSDIGMGDILPDGPRVLATNTGLKLPLDDAGTVKIDNGDSKAHAKLMMGMATTDAKQFFKTHDMIFTNYSQMQTVKGEDTARRQFMEAVAPNAVMIFDESHNAGGQKTRGKSVGPANRSGFARKLVQTANGVFYSSATYAKRPDVMDLYAATDMAMAVDDLDHLAEAIQRGGVPMQQVVATMLSEAGQYIRRERSFDGITYNTPQVEVNRENYDQISHGLAAIQELSGYVSKAVTNISQKLKAEGQAMGYDGATGEAGASSTSFTAVMHNVISQLLLAMKVEPAAQQAIAALKRGEKPVLTVANTMESFLSDYADTLGISPGEEMPADFSDVLMKYLDRTRTVIIKKPFVEKGEKSTYRHYLTDDELGRAGLDVYNKAKAIIAGMDLSDLPVSPIDHLKGQLQKAGYKVGEITGRGLVVDYTGKVPVLRTRSGAETSTKGRNATRFKFNNGDIDAIVINQAGSTGISMHASERVKDKSKRHMFIVQPEGNIDTHMQLLGRVNRTGQVVLPEYSQLVAAIPAEKRPAAVLAKKMASLNANTTASRSSAVTAKDVPDFINEYGDEVAISYLADNFDMNPRLAFPVKISETGKFDKDDAMRKLTGRIPLLPLKEQEEVYEHLEGEYAALLQQLEAAGENALEAKTVDLKAQALTRTTVQAERNKSGSPFAAPVVIEKVSIVRPGKPYKPHELMSRLSAALGGEAMPADMDTATLANMLQQMEGSYTVWGKLAAKREADERKSVTDDFNSYTRPILDEQSDPEKRTKEIDKFNAVKDRWTTVHQLVPIGRRVTLKTASGNLLGIVIDVTQKGEPKNPMALSTWKVTFAVPDATRTVTLPFSRITEDGKSDPDSVLDVEVVPMPQWQEKYTDTLERFARKQTEAREERYIATGNLLAAYDWLDRRGAILNYTDAKGHVRQGILTSRDFDLAEHAVEKGKQLTDVAEIKTWLDANPDLTMTGGEIEIGRESRWSDKYEIAATKAKRKGGIYYLDKTLTDLTGDFYSYGGMMKATIPPQKLAAAVKRMMEIGAKFKVPTIAPKEEKVADDGLSSMSDMTPAAQQRSPEISDLLHAILRHLVGDHAALELREGLMKPVGIEKWGERGKKSIGARGIYSPSQHMIYLALMNGVEKSLFHEAYHAIEYQLQTPQERALMESATDNLRDYIARRLPNFSAKEINSLAGEEVRAIAFEHYADERSRKGPDESGRGLHIGIRKFFDRLWLALRRLGNGLRGLGFETWDDIFNKAYRGEYANAPGTTPRPEAAGDGLSSLASGPGGPHSFDNTIGDIVGRRVAKLLPNFIADRNATEARVQLQDKFVRVKKVEESVQQPVPSHESAYQAEALYYGRTGQRLEQLEQNHIDPLIDEIKGNGLTIDEVNDDLYARHAQERNERIGYQYPASHPFHQAIYDHSIVGASGMSTDEANAILARHMGRVGNFDAVNARVQDIIRRTRLTLLNTGLISQETYDDWNRQYQNYVPLRGFADGTEHEESVMKTGRGYDIRGKEAKKAFGRKSEADGPLNYVLLQAELAIVRGEKNRVGNTMLRFVQSNPDPDRWEVNKPKIIHTIDKNTGLITTMPDNFSDYNDPNVFITKVGGKPYRIRFKGPDGANVARALNNMGATSLHSMVKLFAVLTRTMAKLATQLNPEFTIPNFVRDVGEAFINLQEQQQRDFVKSYAKHILPAVKGAGLAIAGRTNPNDPYIQAFLEMDRAGGRIRFFGLENPDDINRNIASKMRRLEGGTVNSMRDMVEKLGTAVEVINGGVENGVRLATYMAARDVGMSVADSAAVARSVTVDFNRSGEIGGAIGAFYMFYNAAAQGTARTLKAVQSKYVRRAFYTVAAIGAVSALYGIAAGGDDDDGTPFFLKIPAYERDKNFIIMWPKGMGHDGQGVKIPVSFGLAGVFHALGSRLVSVLYGGEKPGKALMAMLGVVANTFDPTGGDENLVAKAFPSALRGQVHIETNKNWTGKPLYPDNSWDKTKPDSQKSFRSDSAFSKAAAEKINQWTGGSKYEPGAIDLHPASIDHWLQTITGGVGRFASGVASTATGLARGDEWEATKTPILRRFTFNVKNAQADSAAYYEERNPEKAKQEQISRARKDLNAGVNVDESAKFLEDNQNRDQGQIFKSADKQLARLRKQERQITDDTSLPDDEKKAQIKELRGQMREIQNEARKQVRELKRGTQ